MDTQTIKPIYRGTQIVWYIFTIIQIILLFRLLVRLISASTSAPFTQFIYTVSAPFMRPFQNLVLPWRFNSGVLDWNILIAMLVYWVVAWIIVELLIMAKPVSTSEAHRALTEDQ
jgi:YggT family protein